MKIHPLTKLALKRINGFLLSSLSPFTYLNEDIFIENSRNRFFQDLARNRMDRSTGKDAGSCLARHHAFTVQSLAQVCTCAVITVSLSSYAGKEPTFHSSCLAAVHQSQQRGRKRPHTQRKLYIFESDI
ncbi:uncharacterized protein LOC107996208 [Apis cerana]|uniref:uncharacterized protein LOC107996208 n=1 Tax=Apis cerana TaxID=7461 RepID=UPI002B229FEC|nr:uncharacterized protein LOC107996208 [Apis cerana]